MESTWTCSKGDSCSFSHDLASGNRRDQRQEGHSSSPALTEREKKPSKKVQATEKNALQTKCEEFRADTEIVTIRHVVIGVIQER